MKVHPTPNRRNVTLSQSNQLRPKKLRRLPHIFAKVLELPFYSDADVVIHETSESLRFVVDTDDDIGRDIRAHTIEIYPGVTKIVVQGTHLFNSSMGEMELDVWRFRLPPSTRPELATAAFSDGELVVTVPKGGNLDNDEDDEESGNGDEVWGEGNGAGRFVLVQ